MMDQDHPNATGTVRAALVAGACFFCISIWSPRVLAQDESTVSGTKGEIRRIDFTGAEPCFAPDGEDSSSFLRKKAIKDLPEYYRLWLMEDAVYVSTAEEDCAFLHLKTDEQRDRFIESFWQCRASNPDALENDFKQEYYRRMVYSNEKFGTEVPGWETDQGHAYVQFGPPDGVEMHVSGESTGRAPGEGPETYDYPWNRWHYRYVEVVGTDVNVVFVDPAVTGDFRAVISIKDKDEFLFPQASLRGTNRPSPSAPIEYFLKPIRVAPVQHKDLEAMLELKVIRDDVYFRPAMEYQRATHATTVVRLTIDIPKEQLKRKDGKSARRFEIFGRVRNASDRVVATFERTGEMGEEENLNLPDPSRRTTMALRPGIYSLEIVVKDAITGKTGTLYTSLGVPGYEEIVEKR